MPTQAKFMQMERRGEGKEEPLLTAQIALRPHFLGLHQNFDLSTLFPQTKAQVNKT